VLYLQVLNIKLKNGLLSNVQVVALMAQELINLGNKNTMMMREAKLLNYGKGLKDETFKMDSSKLFQMPGLWLLGV
jgi:hypothetical protein